MNHYIQPEPPTPDQATQFCIMLQAGLPAAEAIVYFFTEEQDPARMAHILRIWQNSRNVKKAMVALMGKAWQDMTLDERIKHGLDQHYNTLAYMLFSNNYISVGAADKAKLDTARNALEQKLAGLAGKGDALSAFFADLQSGKLKLQKPVPLPPPVMAPMPMKES